MKQFRVLRGMRDLLPDQVAKRQKIIGTIRELFRAYGYEEVETPTLEPFELLAAKIGEEIRHRMYAFEDLGGRKVALRPEMTAPIARLVATKLRAEPKPIRIAYIANCFRYDEPQAARWREFWQAGFELIGSSYPEADAEILNISDELMHRLGFVNYRLRIGQVGILHGVLAQEGVEELERYRAMGMIDKGKRDGAIRYLAAEGVSKRGLDLVRKLFEGRRRAWRALVSEGKHLLNDYPEALSALENLEEILSLFAPLARGSIEVDLGFARGLEYYTGMIFEVYAPQLRVALNGGGRYDKLIELFGGDSTPAVGCSPGIDRIVLAMERASLFKEEVKERGAIVAIDPGLVMRAFEIASDLREKGISVELDVSRRRLKKLLAYASSREMTFVIIVAPSELKQGKVILRDMRRGVQRIVQIEDLPDEVTKLLSKV